LFLSLLWSAAIYRRFCFVFRAVNSRKQDESAAEADALQTKTRKTKAAINRRTPK
jgi:hypothetical protein